MTGIIGIILIIGLCLIAKLFIKINEDKEKKKFLNNEMSEEEQENYLEKLREREKIIAERQLKTTITKTRIISSSSDSRKKVSSSVARGIVGDALLGPVGMVAGVATGKNKITNKTTFLIEYADGHRETKEVENNTKEFEKLCKYLDM